MADVADVVKLGIRGSIANVTAQNSLLTVMNNAEDAKGGVAGATFTVGAPHTSLVNVAIQLTDEAGNDVAVVATVSILLFADVVGVAINAIALDTVAIGTDGVLVTVVANEMYQAVSEADGDIDINFTEATATGDLYLGVVLPNGKIAIATDVITFS